MLTDQQYTEAITFLKDYKDALHCIEQINERIAAVEHYQSFGSTVLSALKNKHLDLSFHGFTKGDNFSEFSLVKAFKFSTDLVNKYQLSTATSREELFDKFSKATQDLI